MFAPRERAIFERIEFIDVKAGLDDQCPRIHALLKDVDALHFQERLNLQATRHQSFDVARCAVDAGVVDDGVKQTCELFLLFQCDARTCHVRRELIGKIAKRSSGVEAFGLEPCPIPGLIFRMTS